MTALGNHHHDFPHLARQSGFYFQLHKGKVNWGEIESLDINDIVEKRNFQLLELNLRNVINCDLEKEYDLKVVDQNFVKLFKLAQLGVDYLSYCEAYLDKCVVILQEQLIAFQEECESLKYEKERRKVGSRSKRIIKTQSYQCEKCEKAFISDIYLKFHDKRRHNILNRQTSFDGSPKKCMDNSQQTENEGKSTASTQTSATTVQDDEDAVKINTQPAVKIENLEQEIQNLKERLKKAENALTEKTEISRSTGFPAPFPGGACHNTMFLLLPSYQTQSGSNHDEVKPGLLVSAPEILRQNSSQIRVPVDPQATENKPSSGSPSVINTELEKIIDEQESGSSNQAGQKFNGAKEGDESFVDRKREAECEKGNVDPNEEKIITKLSRPLPPPRRSKKVIPTRPGRGDDARVEFSAPSKMATQPESESEVFFSQPIVVTSSPVKRNDSSDALERSRESLRVLDKEQSVSNESLCSRKSVLTEASSTSFFKTIVKKNSPKLRTFGQNLRRSLTNLCDSVSSTGKDFMKKESVDRKANAPAVSRLNNRLRQLGVDPEWSGIPKKTMKQKLKALKHRRKLLIKENPTYPIIRQNIEETIFQKLKKNLGRKDANLTSKLDKEAPVSDDDTAAKDPTPDSQTEGIKPQSCVMYDIESDLDSKTSDSEINFDQDVERNVSPKAVKSGGEPHSKTAGAEKEFDLTVFQVGRGSFKEIPQKEVSLRMEELLTDSDTDADSPKEKNLEAFNGYLSDKRNGETAGENEEGQNKWGNQTILGGTDGFQSALQANARKKVWFLGDSDDIEEGLSDSPTGEDDLWSLKSDWEKNMG